MCVRACMLSVPSEVVFEAKVEIKACLVVGVHLCGCTQELGTEEGGWERGIFLAYACGASSPPLLL